MMIGHNSNEGLVILLEDMKSGNPPNAPIQYDYYVPQQMNLKPDSDLRKEIVEKMKKVYSNDNSGDRFLVSILFFLIILP